MTAYRFTVVTTDGEEYHYQTPYLSGTLDVPDKIAQEIADAGYVYHEGDEIILVPASRIKRVRWAVDGGLSDREHAQ